MDSTKAQNAAHCHMDLSQAAALDLCAANIGRLASHCLGLPGIDAVVAYIHRGTYT